MRREKETFENLRIDLDGNEYVGCDFKSCTFVYSGSAIFTMSHNWISDDCRFEFAGTAGNAVHALRAIYSTGEWGRQIVLARFRSIAPEFKDLL